MSVPAVDLGLALWFSFVDLPFLPRPPLYTLHIAQLVLGAVCLRLALAREPISDKSGQIYLNRGLMKALLLIFGVLAVCFSVVGFALDRFWRLP
jgi:hypothetical protein